MSVADTGDRARESGAGPAGLWSFLTDRLHPLLRWAAGAAAIFPLLWGAYTFFEQHVEQRRLDLLNAYNLVDGKLGDDITGSVGRAIQPVVAEAWSDADWRRARACLDEAEADPPVPLDAECRAPPGEPAPTREAWMATLQDWAATRVLAKGGRHDRSIHDYQEAWNNLLFVFRFAQSDPCNAMVVALKFQKSVSDFLYYFPGSYNLDKSGVRPDATAPPFAQLGEPKWEKTEEEACRADLVLVDR